MVHRIFRLTTLGTAAVRSLWHADPFPVAAPAFGWSGVYAGVSVAATIDGHPLQLSAPDSAGFTGMGFSAGAPTPQNQPFTFAGTATPWPTTFAGGGIAPGF